MGEFPAQSAEAPLALRKEAERIGLTDAIFHPKRQVQNTKYAAMHMGDGICRIPVKKKKAAIAQRRRRGSARALQHPGVIQSNAGGQWPRLSKTLRRARKDRTLSNFQTYPAACTMGAGQHFAKNVISRAKTGEGVMRRGACILVHQLNKTVFDKLSNAGR